MSASIITLLTTDHREVAAMLKKAAATDDGDREERRELFSQIDEALRLHTAFEEQHIYPVLQAQSKSHDDALEAIEEHAQVKRLLRDLAATAPQDERWLAKISVLTEDITHHVKEEEQSGGLFDQLKKALPSADLQRLGALYAEQKAAASPSA
jgi:hypothetical protein